jgi:diguanylate cyclase (GGDEF)-like protein
MTLQSDSVGSDPLDDLVTAVATRLMAVTVFTSAEVSAKVLADLVEHFDVDVSFLRHNDHTRRITQLVAEWPPRANKPDPDPLGIVSFDAADPVFSAAEHATGPVFFRPEAGTDGYMRQVEDDADLTPASLVFVPLRSGNVTTGSLGFIKYAMKDWSHAELNALKAIASLFAQVQARVYAEDQLRYLAEHDDLTGLLNRRALLSHLDKRLAADQPGPVCVLYLDLDRLKAVNDYFGHNAGDEYIREFANRLLGQTDENWLIARLGGDEFVAVPQWPVDGSAAVEIASGLQRRLCEQVVIDGEAMSRTVSIGIGVGKPGVDATLELLNRADQALLAAKAEGGNTIVGFHDLMSLRSQFRHDIELHLPGVIATDALTLHYQPEIDLQTGEVVAAEALVRWVHPVHGLLLPESFVDVAESINMATELGGWVLRKACSDYRGWRQAGLAQGLMIRVNVSPIQLVTKGFVDSVAQALYDFEMDSKSLCLEITETMAVSDISATLHTLSELKSLGVFVAIDDFGTGYSVLTHLKSLPVDFIKIDKSFVRDLGFNPGDLAIVRAIIGLAEAFQLEIVAEGVETVAAARTLLQHGCRRAQGFLLSRPLPTDGLSALLGKGNVPVDFSPPITD